MISVNTFFTDTLNTVDNVIGAFVHSAYSNLIQSNAAVITAAFTLYVVILGYRFLTHTLNADLMTITRHMVIMLCVYGLIMSWSLYNLFIYNIFTNEPGQIAQVLIDSSGQLRPGETTAQALNAIFEAVFQACRGFLGHAGFSASGIAFAFYALIVFVIGMFLCTVALLMFIYAKMAMAIGLALGPIFILFLLWEATRELFAAWIRKLVTVALIPIVTSAVLALMLSVINVTLPLVKLPPESQQFSGIMPFLGLSLATAFILTQVYSFCSSLAGGITLSNLSNAINLGKQATQYSGANHALNFSKTAINKASSGIQARRTEQQKQKAEAAINKKIDDFFK